MAVIPHTVTDKYQIEYLNGQYVAPSTDLLKNYSPDDIFMNEERINKLAKRLQDTFDAFKVKAKVAGAKATSLAITYKLQLDSGVKAKAITDLKNEIEYALASSVELGYLREGSNMLRVSVKNINRSLIGLKDIVTSKSFVDAESPLSIAAGMNLEGTPLIFDIAEAPHLLIAGTTGSGKSVFIDDILLSLIFKASPEDIRFLLIDPKHVELKPYNGIPHLLAPVIHDSEESNNYFFWIEEEMRHRFDSFAKVGAKNIDSYNQIMEFQKRRKLPRILIVIDEYADMITDYKEFTNDLIESLARMGRAAGVHLILATQLPIAKIVTPQIKANIPCRASFTVVDGRESRVILDRMGAERLLGNGDMIFSQSDNTAVHAQAAYVSEEELNRVVKSVIANNVKKY